MTARNDDLETVATFSKSLRDHGESYRALNWGSAEGQGNRFRVLCEIGITGENSVLDVGCGLGDFYGYLSRQGIQADYSGLDITPDMIEAAQNRFPGLRFSSGSLLDYRETHAGSFDYVVASGIFYLRQAQPFEHMKTSVERMFALCTKGIAFNCLSTWDTSATGDDEYREDPLKCLSFCRSLSPWVTLRHDYHPGDFTIYLRREGQRP